MFYDEKAMMFSLHLKLYGVSSCSTFGDTSADPEVGTRVSNIPLENQKALGVLIIGFLKSAGTYPAQIKMLEVHVWVLCTAHTCTPKMVHVCMHLKYICNPSVHVHVADNRSNRLRRALS